jgi:DNA-binding FadR family transcriptional regulator
MNEEMLGTRMAAAHATAGRSLVRIMVDQLGHAIVTGVHPPGSALPKESDLAVAFGVGRNAVREAIKILAEKRLIRQERRTGISVLPTPEWNHLDQDIMLWSLENEATRDALVDELSALRVLIEPEVAALAAVHATGAEIARIFEALERMEAAKGSPAGVEADIMFHQRLFEASHNKLLMSLVRTVTAVLRANFALAIQVKEDTLLYLAEHRRVAEAVLQRRPSKARAEMRGLLDNNARHLAHMRSVRGAIEARP